MPRYKLTLEYDGTPFVGWQVQENGPSVQARLAEAIKAFSGEEGVPRGAGRTDAGVHALGQVAHIDLAKDWPPWKVRDALNAQLRPDPISVLACEPAARQVPHALDAGAMHEAAQVLIGNHDFSTFRSAECQASSPVKTLDRLAVARNGEEIRIEAAARSFLHNQVRSMVGSLKVVGEGKWTAHDLRDALEARMRGACGPVAPPCGLYLVQVDY
jgi:tRNA pseudouridine38-40 synthase